MKHFVECTLKVSIPVDRTDAVEIAAAVGLADACEAALEQIVPGRVTATEPRIVSRRNRKGGDAHEAADHHEQVQPLHTAPAPASQVAAGAEPPMPDLPPELDGTRKP
jgi:hypothetical protein